MLKLVTAPCYQSLALTNLSVRVQDPLKRATWKIEIKIVSMGTKHLITNDSASNTNHELRGEEENGQNIKDQPMLCFIHSGAFIVILPVCNSIIVSIFI